MTETLTIEKTLELVSTSARTHADPKVRVVSQEKTWPIGCTARQGDVMITRHPMDKVFPDLTVTTNMQLAPGSSVGSRHVLLAGSFVVFERKNADALHGPIIDAPEGFYLSHPTHGHIDCKLPGKYEVTYPRDLAAEGLQRRRD